ncbi:MAG: hypothetical protein ABWW69_00555 [Pyrodictiaceae archaeon]
MFERYVDMEYLAPLLRLVRSQSLEEDIRLIASEALSLDRFLSTIRGTKLSQFLPSKLSVEDVEKAAWLYYANVLNKLKELSSIAPSIYIAYSMPLIARDLAKTLSALLEGKEVTAEMSVSRHPIVLRAISIGREYGFREVGRVLAKNRLNLLASYLLSPKPETEILDLYVDLEVLRSFAEAWNEYGGEIGAEYLCYRLDAYATRIALNASIIKEQNTIRVVRKNLSTCLVDNYKLLEALEEHAPDRILQVIQTSPYARRAKIESFDEAYHIIRKYSRSRIMRGLAYDPTIPTHSAAVLELILLDVEDIIALASVAPTGLTREAINEILSLSL